MRNAKFNNEKCIKYSGFCFPGDFKAFDELGFLGILLEHWQEWQALLFGHVQKPQYDESGKLPYNVDMSQNLGHQNLETSDMKTHRNLSPCITFPFS